MSNSSLVSYTKISPNRNSPREQPITKITIHHMAGIGSVESFGEIVAKPERQMSANYAIGNDGRIGLYCPESDRSWCSSSKWNDHRAITIEVSNNVNKEPWSVSDAAYNSLIKLCIDICKRNGIKDLKFTGDQNGSLTYHYMFAATGCPGTWLKNHTQDICNKVNAGLSSTNEHIVTLTSGTPIYLEIGKAATGKITVSTKYTIVEEKTVNYVKYGRLKSGAGWVELEKLKRTYNINSAIDIKDLQTTLNAKGYNCGTPDGLLGPRTIAAMVRALSDLWC